MFFQTGLIFPYTPLAAVGGSAHPCYLTFVHKKRTRGFLLSVQMSLVLYGVT